MKNIFSGIITAFSMYSALPMPRAEWNKDTMKYAMCFLPAVGAVIGFAVHILFVLLDRFNLSNVLYSIIFTLVPVLITGGLHYDGFIDTCDAIFSRQSTERKLEILKDPNVGAFGVIGCVFLSIFQVGLWSQVRLYPKYFYFIPVGYVITRILSSIAVVSFEKAKDTGLAYIFSDNADEKKVKHILLSMLFLIFVGILFIDLVAGCIFIFLVTLGFLLFKSFCYKNFNGLTGDLCGFLILSMETLLLFLAAIGGSL